MRGVLNIVIGLIFIVGGLSGKLELIGTGSGLLLAAVGLVLAGMGVYQLANRKR